MRLSVRSYPHPVVGNRDDVLGAAFQATVEMTADKENVYLGVAIKCSSSTIQNLLAEEKATYVMHVDCSNTLFRRAYDFTEAETRIAIPVDQLCDAVEVNAFVRATTNLSGYRVERAHPDYGDADFEIKTGDILAVGEGYVFFIESNFESFSRVGSIMQVEATTDPRNEEMQIDFNGDKIRIILAQPDFQDYKMLRSNDAFAAPLTAAIVLPVLVEALRVLKSDFVDDGSDPRWMMVLRKRLLALGLNADSEPFSTAQKLLEYPIRRALTTSRQTAEAAAL